MTSCNVVASIDQSMTKRARRSNIRPGPTRARGAIYTHRMDALAHLVALRTAWDTRAEFIVMAREQKKPWDEIAEAAGLSRATVINLCNETTRTASEAG